jgi:hypothetical protein
VIVAVLERVSCGVYQLAGAQPAAPGACGHDNTTGVIVDIEAGEAVS